MIKLVDLNFQYNGEFHSPEKIVQAHWHSLGYIPFLDKDIDAEVIKHIDFEGSKVVNGLQCRFFKSRNGFFHIPFRTNKYIKEKKPDIVIVQGLIFPLQIIALRLKLGRKVKIVVQHHGERPFASWRGIFQKLSLRYIDAYIFTSKGNAWKDLKKKIFEILEGSTSFSAKEKRGGSDFLWVGRLNADKDPLTVIKGFAGYLKNNPAAQLYMVYQTEELLPAILREVKANRDLLKAVHFIGKVNHDIGLQHWYHFADFFIAGSHREGSGFALIEALACNCIPVITDIPTFRKISKNGELAFLFETGNAAALTGALKRSLEADRPVLIKKIGEHFANELSFKAIGQKISEVCKQLVSE